MSPWKQRLGCSDLFETSFTKDSRTAKANFSLYFCLIPLSCKFATGLCSKLDISCFIFFCFSLLNSWHWPFNTLNIKRVRSWLHFIGDIVFAILFARRVFDFGEIIFRSLKPIVHFKICHFTRLHVAGRVAGQHPGILWITSDKVSVFDRALAPDVGFDRSD